LALKAGDAALIGEGLDWLTDGLRLASMASLTLSLSPYLSLCLALVAAQNLVAENKRILFRCVAMICEGGGKLLLLCEFGRIGCCRNEKQTYQNHLETWR
jgi:hypothetical protein